MADIPSHPRPPALHPPHQDRRIEYRSMGGGTGGVCRMRAWIHDRPAVLVTEVDDNPGLSITSAVEDVCSAVELALQLRCDQFDLIEHHGATLFRSDPLALVEFGARTVFGRPSCPSWVPVPGRLDWMETAVLL